MNRGRQHPQASAVPRYGMRCAIKGLSIRILRRLGMLKGDWAAALPDELAFWAKALQDPARNWSMDEYRERTDPDLELQKGLRDLIDAPPGVIVRILDVGAGPLTRVGRRWPGRRLEIVPVDPLAAEYDLILGRLGIVPPVRTRVGVGERLDEEFPENSFDLAYASNALDHSYDPLVAIGQMLKVVKPRAFVYLWHFSRVGVAENYRGLHQWNFDVEGAEATLHDGRRKHSLSRVFAGRASLECEITRAFGARVVVARLRKLG